MVNFSKIHIFPFSPRRTTPAASMTDQVAPPCKADRVRRLAELEHLLQQRFFTSLQGMPLRVLVESPLADRPGWSKGTSCRYTPVELATSETGSFVDIIAGPVVENRIRAARIIGTH